MEKLSWNTIPHEQLNPLLSRKAIHAGLITVARLHLQRLSMVPRHSHENEQISMIEKGKLRFIFDDRDVVVSAGEVLVIPPYEAHAAEALEDTVAIDIFSPVREDWRTGNDAYLR